MVESAGIKIDVIEKDVLSKIKQILNENKFVNPVVLQSTDIISEYNDYMESQLFMPQYNKDCPKTKYDSLPGYKGVLKIAEQTVPVIELFVEMKELENKVIITNLSSFCVLKRYSPINDIKDMKFKNDIFFIRVTDLNIDDQKRQNLIDNNPTWLQEYSDKEGFLKQKVLIDLYQKFELEIKEPKSAFCISVIDNSSLDYGNE